MKKFLGRLRSCVDVYDVPTVLMFVFGILLMVMAALVLLAYGGVYVEQLRGLWVPWPPDWVKVMGLPVGVSLCILSISRWQKRANSLSRS